MAPKQRANRGDPSNSVNTADITNKHSTEEQRQWDGQPYLKPNWYMRNQRALFNDVEGARQFLQSGVIVGTKSVTVLSLPHLQVYVTGDYVKGTLEAPFDFSTLPDKCTPILVPDKAATPAEGTEGAPSTPPLKEVIPTTIAELAELLDFDVKRFTVAPEMIAQFDERIVRHWTTQITCDHLQRETLDDCNNRGTTFIILMEKEMSSRDQDKNSASTLRLMELRAHRAAGINNTTVLALNQFVNLDADLNAALSGTPRFEDDDMRALALRETLNDHSEQIFSRIEAEEVRIKTNCLLTKTTISDYKALLTAARNVFTKEENKEMRQRLEGGNVLKFRDTDPTRDLPTTKTNGKNGGKNKKTKKGGKDTPYKKPTRWEEDMRLCKNCKDNPINGGKHLDGDCPTLKGGAKINQATDDDTTAAMNLFTGDGTTLSVSLDSLDTPADLLASIAQGSGRVAMMKYDHDDPTPESLAWTLAGRSSGDESNDGDVEKQPPTFKARRFYVLPNKDPSGGIFYGHLYEEVIPVLQSHFTDISRDDLVSKLLTCADVDDAITACKQHNASTIFHGPAVLAGTQPGDDLGDDDDDDGEEDASVTTNSTTLASDAAALATSLAQRPLPTEPAAPRALERRTVFIFTYSGHDGIYFSSLGSDASRLAHVLATIRKEIILTRRELSATAITDDALRAHLFMVEYNSTGDEASQISPEYATKMLLLAAAAALAAQGRPENWPLQSSRQVELPVAPPSHELDEIYASATITYHGPDAVAAGQGGDIYTPGRLIKFDHTPLRQLLCRTKLIPMRSALVELLS